MILSTALAGRTRSLELRGRDLIDRGFEHADNGGPTDCAYQFPVFLLSVFSYQFWFNRHMDVGTRVSIVLLRVDYGDG